MTKKRFTFHHDIDGIDYIEDESNGFCLICDELMCSLLNELHEENEQLKKELHLMHMRTMFSTVQSFKGNVSKRYKYSEKTDTVYDTANHYGQYDKILDKKEIVMLLNEYETVLNELKGDVE